MAPELLQKGKMTRAADVYSFAMIMVELFTCKRLFEGLAQQQVCCCHLPAPGTSLRRGCLAAGRGSHVHLLSTVSQPRTQYFYT